MHRLPSVFLRPYSLCCVVAVVSEIQCVKEDYCVKSFVMTRFVLQKFTLGFVFSNFFKQLKPRLLISNCSCEDVDCIVSNQFLLEEGFYILVCLFVSLLV